MSTQTRHDHWIFSYDPGRGTSNLERQAGETRPNTHSQSRRLYVALAWYHECHNCIWRCTKLVTSPMEILYKQNKTKKQIGFKMVIMSRAWMVASFLFVLIYILVGVDASFAAVALDRTEAERLASARTGRSEPSSRAREPTAATSSRSRNTRGNPQLVSPTSIDELSAASIRPPVSSSIRQSAISSSSLRSRQPRVRYEETIEGMMERQEREREAQRAAERRDISRGKPHNIEPTNPQVQVRREKSLSSNVAYK